LAQWLLRISTLLRAEQRKKYSALGLQPVHVQTLDYLAVSINPSDRCRHHAEVQMIGDRLSCTALTFQTRVITEKIAYLVKQGLPARHIAALTFTNKASREMKARVSKLLDDKELRGLRVSTFHSLGLEILRKEHKTLQYKAGISLFDEQDKITLLKNLITHSSQNYDIDAVNIYSGLIGQWKNSFVTPKQALSLANAEEQEAAQIYVGNDLFSFFKIILMC
jgi:hypothetical protein